MKMKSIFAIILGVFSLQVQASEKWYSNVVINPTSLGKFSEKSVVFTIDRAAVKKTFLAKPSTINLEFPVPGGFRTIEFSATDIHAEGFKVLNATGRDVTSSLEMPVHFKGTNNKIGKQLASLSVFSDGNFVLLYSTKEGNVNISSLPTKLGGKADDYVSFIDSDLKKENPFKCGIDHDGEVPANPMSAAGQSGNSVQNDSICRLTEIYWECDFDMFQKGGSLQGTLNQFEAMFTGSAILYEIETINLGVKAVKVWDSPDPYTYTSSFTALDDFQAAGNAANWPGQLAHLLSTRPLNLGGVAYLNALCSDFRYGFSNIDFLFADLPVYSWTLSTIAHELGHNFSSNHTHNCGWEVSPGVIQQIDSCWNAEGGCQSVVKGRIGTIMSYCHLTGSVNLSLGFGPLPGDRIREGYANMPCVAGTIVIPNFTPSNSGPYCIGDTITFQVDELAGYAYQWTGPNGFSSNERLPLVTNLQPSSEGIYSLKVKKLACSSREKKTNLVFNCMQVGTLPVTTCAGSEITIPMSSTGVFNPDNRFIAQLSNNAGSFSNPVNLDTIYSSQAQSLTVNLPGNLPMGSAYKVRFLSTSPAYEGKPQAKSLNINPIGPSPTPVNGERCGTGSVQISANGGSSLIWTPSFNETVPVFQGRKFNTPSISQSTSFFVQSGGTNRASAGKKTPEGNSSSSLENGIKFTSAATFRLDSVSLFHTALSSSGLLCEIVLSKNGTEIMSRNFNGVQGSTSSKVPLFWKVSPGDGYELKCRNISVALATSPAVYPMKVTNLLSMESATTGSALYPYLFDWVIAKYTGCPSKKVEVLAKILNGQVPPTALILASSDTLICQSVAPTYEWMVNGQVQAGINSAKIRGLLNSAYQVRYKLDSCWSEWSEPFVVTAVTKSANAISGGIKIRPNPSDGTFFWDGPEENFELTLFGSDGKMIWQSSISGKERIDLKQLSEGIYLLKWISRNSAGTERLSIIH